MERLKAFMIGCFWLSHDYFTENKWRMVFFFSICGAILAFIIASISGWNLVWIIALLCVIVALIISCRETRIKQKKFHIDMKVRKALSTTNQDDKHDFTPDEQNYIRMRDRSFRYTFWVKVLFVLLILVLIINLV